jgi:hypothetical protein
MFDLVNPHHSFPNFCFEVRMFYGSKKEKAPRDSKTELVSKAERMSGCQGVCGPGGGEGDLPAWSGQR